MHPDLLKQGHGKNQAMHDLDGLATPLVTGNTYCVEDAFDTPPLDWFPKSCSPCGFQVVNEQVQKLFRTPDVARNRVKVMEYVSGPAVKLAWKANSALWLAWLLFFPLAYAATRCPDAGAGSYAEPPAWLYVFAVPPLLFVIYLEHKCLSYVVAVQRKECQRFCLFIFEFKTYWQWHIFVMLFSLASKASIFTNGLFAAKTMKMHSACEDYIVNQAWHRRMQQSIFSQTFIADLDFEYFVFFAWCLMGLQFVFAFFTAFPVGPPKDHTKEKSWSDVIASVRDYFDVKERELVTLDWDVKYGGHVEYSTLLSPFQNHGMALQALADSSRMASLSFQDPRYSEVRLSFHADKFEEAAQNNDVNNQKHHAALYMYLGRRRFVHGIYSFLLVGVCDAATMLNYQISFAGLAAASLDSYEIGYAAYISIAFSTILLLIKLRHAFALFRLFMKMMYSKHSNEMNSILAGGPWQSVKHTFAVFLVSVIVFVFLTILALVKGISFFRCPDYMWGVNGCVALA